MAEEENEETREQNHQINQNFLTKNSTKFKDNAKTPESNRKTFYQRSDKINTKESKSEFAMALTFLFVFLIRNAHCDCVNSYVQEKFYVSSRSYCWMKYDACASYQFSECSEVICDSNGENCVTVQGIQSSSTCTSFCCQNYNDPNNSQNSLSYKFCNPPSDSSSSSTIPLGTILVAVCTTAFVGTIVFLCVCRRIRNRNNEQNINAYNGDNQIAQVTTSVDLKKYKVETEGPYFIDSKETCVICLDSKVNLRTHCGHYYHGNCLLAWLKKKQDNPCPLCMGMTYNPIKVYCTSCHYGDILINIENHTSEETVKKYDSYKCSNCANLNEKSFTLEDENESPVKNERSSKNSQKKVKIEIENNGSQQGNKSKRRKRLHREVSSRNGLSEAEDVNAESLKNLNDKKGHPVNEP